MKKFSLREVRRQSRMRFNELKIKFHDKGKPFSCVGEGCNGCCRGSVPCHPDEINAVMDAMDEAAWGRVRKSKAQILADPRKAKCPLLAPDGKCSVYKERPIGCRMYAVTTPKEYCYYEYFGEEMIASPTALIEASAAALLMLFDGDAEKMEAYTMMLGVALVNALPFQPSGDETVLLDDGVFPSSPVATTSPDGDSSEDDE